MEEQQEMHFVDGMIFNKPHENAPDFVKGSLSVKVDELVACLQKYKKEDGWANIDMKKSKAGKIYFQFNTWKPEKQDGQASPDNAEDTPF